MKTDDNEKNRYQRALVLVLFIIISLLIHLLIFGTFLNYGFKTHAKRFMASMASYLSPSDKKFIQEQAAQKHDAINRILQSAKQNHERKPTLFIKNKLQNTRPAKLVAPKSNFGWVIFDTQHKQPERLEIPHTKQGDVSVSKMATATETKPESKIETKKSNTGHEPEKLEPVKIEVNSNQQPKTQPEAPKAHKKIDPIDKKNISAKMPNVSIKNGVEITEIEHSKPVETVKQRIEEIEKLQQQIATYSEKQTLAQEQKNVKKIEPTSELEPQQEQREMTKEEEKNMILSSMLRKDVTRPSDKDSHCTPSTDFVWGTGNNKKTSKNLIQLTKGYIEKWRGESGTDPIDRDGDPNKRPSFEELKYISYESKINWCLQASWKDNFAHRQSIHMSEGKAVIEFTIDESGKLLSTKMLQSSGYREVDSAIIKNFEFASPFPPLPKHFGTKTYSTGRIITVYAQRFGL
ncbi:MAG: TonB protein [candidate division TM6 bacterium GW2011_GWF2_37_49]|nr:MAG: TonB protein [candidate division TM6 bacterium GW2011_GWF2_37_49]